MTHAVMPQCRNGGGLYKPATPPPDFGSAPVRRVISDVTGASGWIVAAEGARHGIHDTTECAGRWHPVARCGVQGGDRSIKRRRPPEGGRRDASTVSADRGRGQVSGIRPF
ncbi:hypothetical protein [Ralstonia syzygii]|uniref:hypothetical protein n=1 Tax=Ralstonia syzygii TaxID=28097 RepID=UPI0018D01F29|nr:hypothetical protein [Ralstonia syzygii]